MNDAVCISHAKKLLSWIKLDVDEIFFPTQKSIVAIEIFIEGWHFISMIFSNDKILLKWKLSFSENS
jgi:hypothetical protein